MLDLMERKVLDLSRVRVVVLDEADEMLSMGFIEDIETILAATPTDRQTALLSATLSPEIRRLADRYLRDPRSVTTEREQVTVAAIEQRTYLVNNAEKLAALTRLFEMEPITSALIFVRTAERVSWRPSFPPRGFPAERSGELEQDERAARAQPLPPRQPKVLVATDVAARGLDIENISHVFNFDLPEDPGNLCPTASAAPAARARPASPSPGDAGRTLAPGPHRRLHQTAHFSRNTAHGRADRTAPEEQLLEQVTVWLKRGRTGGERRLAAPWWTPATIRWKLPRPLRHVRTVEGQRSILPITEVQERRPRHARGRDAIWRDQAGRAERSPTTNARRARSWHGQPELEQRTAARGAPSDVVSTIAYHADIPGHAIGKIFIRTTTRWLTCRSALSSRCCPKRTTSASTAKPSPSNALEGMICTGQIPV
ncbi:DEAD/DEAH box helicase [Candidatus Amarolinea dominans]|uniref:DEAD/DEAH box helicase n=1 Tax=Candidatus Amarolinea dominans TaxID=3140696 RepID=UPI001D6CA7EE|nr:DEAD/DEAH box helicase [Anaerolineae bacterium]